MNSTRPSPQVWPTLRARDARALIRFLVDIVGFTETVVYGDDSRVDHAELSWPPGGGIMLGSFRENDTDPSPSLPGSLGAYVVTEDIDELHTRIAAAGVQVTTALHDTDYGSRDFGIKDPEGNRWMFGTYPGAPVQRP